MFLRILVVHIPPNSGDYASCYGIACGRRADESVVMRRNDVLEIIGARGKIKTTRLEILVYWRRNEATFGVMRCDSTVNNQS